MILIMTITSNYMLIHLIKRGTIRPLRGRRKVDVGFALLHRRQGHAGEDAPPVDMHGACTAFAAIACFLGAGQSQFFTPRIKQRHARLNHNRV